MAMDYQGTTYTVVQGIERRVWKRSVSVAGVVLTGQEETKSAAVAAAEKAIDRALAMKRVRLVPPGDRD
jgi:3-oxoacyl-[acyl-carrier-protein] synthase III